MDYSIKPSLASYDMRPDTYDVMRPSTSLSSSGLNKAKDNDDTLLALVDRQSEVAAAKAGRHPQALEEASEAKKELDELWKAMTGASLDAQVAESSGDYSQLDPVLRSHLSRPPRWLGRAIESSIQARLCLAVEMEYSLPNDQFQAALDAAHAMDQGLPPPHIHPPGIGGPLGGPSPTSKGSRPSSRMGCPAGGRTEDDRLETIELPQVGSPLPPHTSGQEMQMLYHEALRFAVKLLPKGHRAYKEAVKSEKEARDRWQQAIAHFANLEARFSRPNSPTLSQEEAAAEEAEMEQEIQADEGEEGLVENEPVANDAQPLELPPLSRTAKTKRRQRGSGAMSPFESAGSGTGSFAGSTELLSSELDGGLFQQSWVSTSYASASTAGTASTHSEWVKNAPPGDVFFRSLPWSFSAGSMCSSGSSPKNKKKKKRSNSPEGSPKAAQEPVDPDPFKDWKKNYMNVGSMSLFQRKLLNFEGQNSLRQDLNFEKKKFKHFMTDLAGLHDAETRMTDDRILFTEHGVKASKIGQAKSDAVRKKAWRVSEAGQRLADEEKGLFEFYGLGKQYDNGVDVKSLRKLMQESFERSPAETQRRKEEEARKKRLADMEAERRRRSLAASFGFQRGDDGDKPKQGRRRSSVGKSPSAPALLKQNTGS